MLYLDVDRASKQFIIKETLSQRVLVLVPHTLMHYDDQDIVKRFKWVDATRIMVANKYGLEKLLEVKEGGFNELGDLSIPYYNSESYESENLKATDVIVN